MTALAVPGPAAPGGPRPTVQAPTARSLLASEWIKLRSLRSTWWAVLASVVAVVLFAPMRTASIAKVPEAFGSEHLVGAVYVTSGSLFAQLIFCALGVVAITGEYRTGQIRSSFTAAPGRLGVLWSKLAVIVATVFVASIAAVLLAWAASAPSLTLSGMSIDLTSSEDLRILFGTPLVLAAATALGYAIGALVRSSAAGIAAVLGLLLVVENVLALIPWAPLQNAASFLPGLAGSRLVTADALGSVTTASTSTVLGPWQGYGVMLAWVLGLMVVASVLVRRRDA
ncbi:MULTISPECIES: ABC transporter permease [unclassified Actinotalea]|uniref:ABC transporter permease n=1 Tax=unclassified Actinotalea TaxID=2638618 RepID=UPI0015F77678|nr:MULTISPECIES: ABC transporter permease [unclassified Actinotalea]